jgi:homocysteine S-methyltransferase
MTHPRQGFLEALSERPLVFDGAIGTQLYERGIYVNRSFDDANLSRVDLVRTVHEDYLGAGADVLTTNTFSANRIRLAKHGLEDKAEAIVRAGARIAIEVAAGRAWVAGSIGPSGATPTIATADELADIKAAFADHVRWLVDEGVDLLIFETFRQLSELRMAMEAAREVAPDVPIVAQMAFDAEQHTSEGAAPERVVRLLADWGADVVGANCVEGPHGLFEIAKTMVGHGLPVVVQPNAGYPRRIEDRFVYMATPDYFQTFARRYFKAGVAAVGGCCGTGPEHVRKIAAAARMMSGGRSAIVYDPRPSSHDDSVAMEEVPVAQRSALADKVERVWRERVMAPAGSKAPLGPDNFVVSVEVNPPKGLDPMKALRAARMLKDGGVDVINIADGPRASVRMSNWALGKLLMDEVDTEVIIHLCGRDRNLLGLQADVLAYHTVGLHNMVVITGDPPKVGDYPHATAVFDLDSIGILRMIQSLNRGVDPAGKPVNAVTNFYCACGAEPAAQDYDRELRRLELKKEAGATMVMTQPVYDPRVLERFLDDIAGLELPVLVGILPLASHRNAEFLHNEVPGMSVPAEIRARMQAASSSKAAGRAEGVKIAQEALTAVADRVVGAYVMPPFGRYAAALEVLECVGYTRPDATAAAGE